MSDLSPDLTARLAKLIPRLASGHQGEVAATAAAIVRTLRSSGCDLHVRDVPAPQHVVDMLTRWLAVHHVANPRGLVFTTTSGTHIFPWNFSRSMWLPLLDRAGLGGAPQFHFHALRHFAASWMIENGLPVTVVAILLGHSKFDMTLQVYAHPVIPVSRRHEAMDRMASSLMPAAVEAGNGSLPALTN